MPAATLQCPACGANASADETRCSYCGAALATVACPSCFGLIFRGAKFCSHCGAKVERTELASDAVKLCPRCKTAMKAVMIGESHLDECPACEGLWADVQTLKDICTKSEQQTAVLGLPAPPLQPMELEKNIHYLPCPICHNLMNRVNFAHCSHVIVNVCRAHGTWFDKDQLRRVVEFIRDGGMEKARVLELSQMEEERHRLEQVQQDNRLIVTTPLNVVTGDYTFGHRENSDAADIMHFLFSLFEK